MNDQKQRWQDRLASWKWFPFLVMACVVACAILAYLSGAGETGGAWW